jgi:3-hydroxy-9,10-secoandrosta-1,3,5(10)-triene-9,17-dione monooxygenase
MHVPSMDELKERAAGLVPLLQSNAERTERDGRIAEENIVALREAELFHVMRRCSQGGFGYGVKGLVEVCGELGRGCGSTAWIVSFVNIHSSHLTTKEIADEIYTWNPDALICGVGSPSGRAAEVDGGVVLSGRWAFASGCLHADWAWAGVAPHDGDPSPTIAHIPLRDLTIEHTWQTAGMQGTGSHTLVASELFVPRHRISAPFGKTTTLGVDLSVGIAAPIVGMAQGALDIVRENLGKGKPTMHMLFERSQDVPSTQIAFAEAVQSIDTAKIHLRRAAGTLEEAEEAGVELSLIERTRARMDVTTAIESCRQAVGKLLDLHGASGFALANPLQRAWRDLETGSRHAWVTPAIGKEAYGRALLGVEEPITMGI